MYKFLQNKGKKVKRGLGLMVAAVMVCNMLSVNAVAFAANDNQDEISSSTVTQGTEITYQKAAWNGSEVIYTEETSSDYTVVEENSTEEVTWETGYYVVLGTVNIAQPVTVSGDVKLILADNCTLNAESGIVVTTGNTLEIYAQSGGSGILNATGVHDNNYSAGAGIGGSIESVDCGTIHIHGGVINAIGGSDGRWYGGTGIGGGSRARENGGSGGDIVIYGGVITAESGYGSVSGTGIGGGFGGVFEAANGGDSGTINIYGGSVTAEAYGDSMNGSGAGIGGGAGCLKNGGNGNDIRIYGGTVKATGGFKGAGIGGGAGSSTGKSGDGTSIIISGGQVTAVGGRFAAGIGGGGGYHTENSYGITTDYFGGVGNDISITGGIVDARGGNGNNSGNEGMPIGNGGNQEAESNVIKSDAIIFENSVGLVYGEVILNGDYVIPDDCSLTIPPEATIKGDGTIVGGGDFKTENITDAIIVPEELYYTGENMTDAVEAMIKIADTVIICNREFTVVSSDGWEKSITPQVIQNAGEYTVTFTKEGKTPVSRTFNVKQSGTTLENTVHVFNDGDETLNFNANDTITIKAVPKLTGEVPKRASSRRALNPDEMAIFYTDGDSEIQLSETESMNADGSYIMTCSASDVMGVIEGLPSASETITLTIKYVGNDNMSSADTTVDITISAVAQVIDETSGNVSYVSAENFVAAFPGYRDTNVIKTITMLDDLTIPADDMWDSALIKVGGNVTFNLNNHSIVCTNNNVFYIYGNGNLTVVGDGEIKGEEGINIGNSGAADIRGGTITGSPFWGVLVQNDGKLKVSGDAEIKSTGDFGLYVSARTEVSLSGGTFSGKDGAIEYGIWSDDSLLTLLDNSTETKYAYFHGDTPINENLEGKSSGDTVSLTLPGVVTVKPCTHIWEAQHVSDTTTHTYNCFACGSTKEAEECSYEFTNEGTESTGVCECGSVVKVSLNDVENITYNGNSHTPDVMVMLNENELESENYIIEEYTDNVNAGKANVSVKGTNGYNFMTKAEFIILPANLTITNAVATDREYNGTKIVDVTDIILEGKVGNDDVAVDTSELKGTISEADVGEYTSITLPELTLTGTSKGNYKLIQPDSEVSTNVKIIRTTGTLTIPDMVISKIFGDAGLSLNCTTNGDGKITYSSDNENVVIVSEDGNVDIKGAGSAVITVSLMEGNNYTGADSQTINVDIAKSDAPTLNSETRKYVYTIGSDGSVCIDIADKLPDNRGETQYSVVTSDENSILSDVAIDENGKLNFIVVKDNEIGSTATISVTAEMSNYNDAVFTMNIVLVDKKVVELKAGSSVTVKESKQLIYGEAIESLEFNSAIFVEQNTNQTVEGTLTWKNPSDTPSVGTTSAEWIFTPYDNDKYETLEGSADIIILPANLIVTNAVATDREYNGTKIVDVTDITLEGKFGNDDVAVDTSELKGTISKADVGEYTSLTLPAMTLTGTSKGNYKLIQPDSEVSTNVNIIRTTGTLTIPDMVISKIFGDIGVFLGCKTNGDGKITYSSDNENVVIVSEDGNVEIKGAGSAAITVSLMEGNNYTGAVSQTINIDIAKSDAPILDSETRKYVYTIGSEGSVCIDIADKFPDNRGETQYSVATSDADSILSDVAIDENGKLNFTVVKDNEIGSTATIRVTAEMSNYNDATFTMNIVLVDKKVVELKAGSSVTVKESKPLIYGEAIESLEFNSAIFVEQDTNMAVEGTLTWKNPSATPSVGTTSAEWIFTPYDNDKYETLEGSADILVEKAMPYIVTPPTASEITYGDTLEMSVLTGGMAQCSGKDTTSVEGSFVWKDTGIKPVVNDSNATDYAVVFIPYDKVNFNSVEAMVKLIINPAENAPDMPLSDMKCLSSCKKVEDVELPEGWAWKESDKATLLEAEKTVTVTAIYIGTDKENYKNVSVSVEITKDKCTHMNTEIRNIEEASCDKQGYDGDTYCTDCDTIIAQGSHIPELGHNWQETIEKQPTATEKGIMKYTCIRCNEIYTKEIDKLQDTSEESSEKATKDNGQTTSENPETGDSVEVSWIVIIGAMIIIICISDFFILKNKKRKID